MRLPSGPLRWGYGRKQLPPSRRIRVVFSGIRNSFLHQGQAKTLFEPVFQPYVRGHSLPSALRFERRYVSASRAALDSGYVNFLIEYLSVTPAAVVSDGKWSNNNKKNKECKRATNDKELMKYALHTVSKKEYIILYTYN